MQVQAVVDTPSFVMAMTIMGISILTGVGVAATTAATMRWMPLPLETITIPKAKRLLSVSVRQGRLCAAQQMKCCSPRQ